MSSALRTAFRESFRVLFSDNKILQHHDQIKIKSTEGTVGVDYVPLKIVDWDTFAP